MSNERPDEFFSWRSIISPPDALPEQGLDNSDHSWERLSHRLREKPSGARYLSLRYRIAAACVLLALIPATRLLQNHPAPGSTPQTNQSSPTATLKPASLTTSPATQPVTINPENTHLPEASPVFRSAPPPYTSFRGGKKPAQTAAQTPAPAPAPPSLTPTGLNPAPASANPALARTITASPSPPNIATVIPTPVSTDTTPTSEQLAQLSQPVVNSTQPQNRLKNKQLRIIHNNEIDNPIHSEPSLTSVRSREPDLKVLIILKNH